MAPHRWQKGESGNPKGGRRKVGASLFFTANSDDQQFNDTKKAALAGVFRIVKQTLKGRLWGDGTNAHTITRVTPNSRQA